MNIFEPSGRASIPAWMAAKARSSERGFFGSLQLINGDREYAVVWDEEEKLNARHHHQAMLSNTRCKLAERGKTTESSYSNFRDSHVRSCSSELNSLDHNVENGVVVVRCERHKNSVYTRELVRIQIYTIQRFAAIYNFRGMHFELTMIVGGPRSRLQLVTSKNALMQIWTILDCAIW